MLIFQYLRKQIFRLEKLIFLPKKCVYFISYRNEHPVYMLSTDFKKKVCCHVENGCTVIELNNKYR